jgi:hypothetical protein
MLRTIGGAPLSSTVRRAPRMQQPFIQSGGAQIGWVNASWPLARISAQSDRLVITVRLLGTYTFSPEQISTVERYVLVPVLAWGVRVRHRVPEYPQRVIFWCLGSPETVLGGIRDSGFVPTASGSAVPVRQGIPVRWSAIIASVLIWNALFMLPFAGYRHSNPAPDWLVLLPLCAVFALSVGTLTSRTLQRLILKPGRNVGEIQPFLRLLAFICGLLSVIFSILVATGAFKQAPNPPSAGDAGRTHLLALGRHRPGAPARC